MDKYFCNINNINENVEDFVIAKNKIERPLIESEKLEKKMSIQEFIEYVDLSKNILMLNNISNDVIPFNIYKNEDNYVIIYSSPNNKGDILIEHLEKINYDLNNLKQLTPFDLINGKIKDSEYYIIDSNYYSD